MPSPESQPLPDHLEDSQAAKDLFASLAREAVEVIALVYLDTTQRLLGMRQMRSVSATTLVLPIRQIVTDALAFNAAGVVMAHNHPSGDPTPSAADRDATQRLRRTLTPLGVQLLDHLVVARSGVTSFRALGLL